MLNPVSFRFLKYLSISRTYKISRLFCSVSCQRRLPDLDLDYLCDPKNRGEIRTNIKRRDAKIDLDNVLRLHEAWKNGASEEKDKLKRDLISAAFGIPNRSHPDILSLGPEPKVVKHTGTKKVFRHKIKSFDDIAEKLGLIRTKNLTHLTGHRSYFLIDHLAMLEDALIQYSVDRLLKKGFELISVPDILERDVIESCGMNTRGERNQVYTVDETMDGKEYCLSGTAEMGIGSFLQNKTFKSSELPLRLMSVSRCFRAETSAIADEKGLYRVHQFTKVEMFGVTDRESSGDLLKEFVDVQEELLGELGLELRRLDMPQEELGAQAYRKYDVEAWMPGRGKWGELTSASDCTDYQARRLSVAVEGGGFAHTVNGTACAAPRVIIALVETHQNPDGTVAVPDLLVPYMGTRLITKSRAPKLTPFKRAHDITS